jgi:hypothetical protein
VTRFWVQVGGETTSALVDAGRDHDVVFVCAHGAGGHMEDRSMVALAEALSSRGLTVVRFNFLYSEKKSKRPDRMPRLIECFTAVVDRVRKELQPKRLVLGGRSMGGRASSMMAAEGFACDALCLYAYPLHPAGEPEKLRDAHLARIRVPVLCFNGTRDELCTRSLMEKATRGLSTWRQVWIDGADHGFHVLKASGTNDAAVLARVAEQTLDFTRP